MQRIIWIIGAIILMGCVRPGGEVEPIPATLSAKRNAKETPRTATPMPATTPEAEVAQPLIDQFVVAAGTQAGAGDRVSVSWKVRHGGQVSLCYWYFQEGETSDDPVSVAGEHCVGNLPQRAEGYELTLAPPAGEGAAFYVSFLLQVMNGIPAGEGRLQAPIKEAMATQAVPTTCAYRWFRPGASDWCPRSEPAVFLEAIAQRFEQGLAFYLPRRGPAPNRLVVLYDDGRTTGAMGFPVTAAPA